MIAEFFTYLGLTFQVHAVHNLVGDVDSFVLGVLGSRRRHALLLFSKLAKFLTDNL